MSRITISARAALEKARDQLEAPVVAALEAEIAKTEGADPIAESVRLYEQLKSETALRSLVIELIDQGNNRLLGPYAEKLYAATSDPRDIVLSAKAYADAEDFSNFLRIVEVVSRRDRRSPHVKQRYGGASYTWAGL